MNALFLTKNSRDIFQEIYDELVQDQELSIGSGFVSDILRVIIVQFKHTIKDLLEYDEKDFKRFSGVNDKNVIHLIHLQQSIRLKYYKLLIVDKM